MSKVDENKKGIKVMADPRRYGIERVAYLLMRLIGLGLLKLAVYYKVKSAGMNF